MVSILNFFNQPKHKDLEYFIKLASSLNKENDPDSLRFAIYEGIGENPNLTKEIFLTLLSKAENRYAKEILLQSFVKEHIQRENLEWVWNLLKKQKQDKDNLWLSSLVYSHSIYHLDNKDPLILEMINYFLKLEGQTWNSPAFGETPYLEYGFVLEYLIRNSEDLNQLDKYVNLYTDYLKADDNSKPYKQHDQYLEYRILSRITTNKNLGDQKAKELFDRANKLYIEEERVRVIAGLLRSEKISQELFDQIFESRKLVKNKSLLHNIYTSIALNKTFLPRVFDILLDQLERGFSRGRDSIFFAVLRNEGLTDTQYNNVISIIEKQIEGKDFLTQTYSDSALFGQLNKLMKIILERKNLEKNMVIKLLELYFDFLSTLDEELKKDDRIFLYYFNIPVDIVSDINLDNELFRCILNKNDQSLFRNQILGSLLSNTNLGPDQYEKIADLLNSVYFANDKLRSFPKDGSSNPDTPKFVLKNWAGSAYVK